VSATFAKRVLALAGAFACLFATPPASLPSLRVWEKPIARGLTYREEIDFASHHSIFALRLSLRSTAVHAVCALAGGKTYDSGTTTGRHPLSQILASQSGLAGVNGDFFSMESGPSGDPLGLAVRDGHILSTPSKRTEFGWGPADAMMSTSTFEASVVTDTGSLNIDGINRKCPDNQVTLDTEDAGRVVAPSPSLRVLIRVKTGSWTPTTTVEGSIVSVSTEGPDEIAAGEAVLVARGNKIDALRDLHAGTDCRIILKTSGFDWQKIDSVVGGGPALVRGGTVALDSSAEGFVADFSDKKHPRTAIGRTVDNDIWLVAVDGRQETGDGMTLTELAHTMLRLGCVDAMNLDGGGSTTMNVLGVTVNRPSDGKERLLAEGVILVGSKPTRSGSGLRLSVPSKLDSTTTAFARVLDAGESVPNIDVIWGASGSCAIDGAGQITVLSSGPGTITASCAGRLLTRNVTAVRSQL
jgi:exopolysaccharide biosynthesis protein